MKTGSDWLRGCRITKISPLGAQVADLLGDLFSGLYHLDGAEKVDWANDHHIEVRVAYKEWASVDSNLLTKLVFLAHDRCLRVSISPRSAHAQTLLFHQRRRAGGTWERHPTIEQALALYREYHPVVPDEIEATT